MGWREGKVFIHIFRRKERRKKAQSSNVMSYVCFLLLVQKWAIIESAVLIVIIKIENQKKPSFRAEAKKSTALRAPMQSNRDVIVLPNAHNISDAIDWQRSHLGSEKRFFY